MENIVECGYGVLLYLCQEGWGIGLINKICVYYLQDNGMDMVEVNEYFGFDVDMCIYDMCKVMLDILKVKNVEFMINNFCKIVVLEVLGINVVVCKFIDYGVIKDNKYYICIKIEKLGYVFDLYVFGD